MGILYKAITILYIVMQVISSPLSVMNQMRSVSAKAVEGINVLDSKDKTMEKLDVTEKGEYQLKISDSRVNLEKMEIELPDFLTYKSADGLTQNKVDYAKDTNKLTFNLDDYKVSKTILLTLVANKGQSQKGDIVLKDFDKNGKTSKKVINAKLISEKATKETVKEDKTTKDDSAEAKMARGESSNVKDIKQTTRQLPSEVPDPPKSNIVLTDTFQLITGSNSYVHPTNKNEVVVTDDKTYMKGGLWYKNKINLAKDFDMGMYVFLGDKNQPNKGADGITFVMQNDPVGLAAVGASGAGIGAYGKSGEENNYIKNGLALEFDTYRNNSATKGTNDGDIDEIAKDYGHIAIQKTQSVARNHENTMLGTATNQLANNKWRKVDMSWSAQSKTLSYTIEGFGSKTYKIANPNALFGGDQVYWGFTGSTGTYTNNQAVAIDKLPDQTKSTLKKDVKNITNKDADYKTTTIEKKGDIVEYRLAYESDKENTQVLLAAELKDVLDGRHTYVPGSLTIDGNKQTDAVWNNGTIKLGDVTPGTKRDIVFQVKVDGTGDILNQAMFSSKYANPVESNKTTIYNGDAVITKTDGDTGVPLKGVKYVLKDANGKVIKSNLTTNDKGQFDLHYLEPGKYTVEESSALPGYIKDTKSHSLVITKDQKTPATLDLKNYKEVVKPELTKSVSVKSAKLGDTFTYTLKVTNPSSNGTWNDVVMTDNLDTTNLELVANSTTSDGSALSDATVWNNNKTFTYKVGNLKAGESKTVTFKVKVINIPAKKIIDNTVSATGKDAAGKEVAPKDAKVSTPVDYKDGELISTKTVTDENGNNINGKEVKVGDTIHFDIKVKNTVDNSIVTNVIVKDSLIKAFAFKTGTLTVTDVNGVKKTVSDTNFKGQDLSINVGSIKGQEDVTVGFDVTITEDADGDLKNVGLVSGTTPGGEVPPTTTPETENNAQPKPTLKKESNVKHILGMGDKYGYRIKVGNEKGAGIWHNAQVTDSLETKYLEYVPGSTKLDGKSVSDATVWNKDRLTMKLGDLKAGETKTITFEVKVKEIPATQTVIPNVAKATGEDSKGNAVNPPDSKVLVPVDYRVGELSIVKTVSDSKGNNLNGDIVKIGDTLHFEVTVNNISEVGTIVKGIKVKDELINAFKYTAGTLTITKPDGTVVSAADSNFNGQKLDLDAGNLKGQESLTVGFDVTVTPDATGELENVALVSGTDPEIPETPTPPTTNYVNPKPSLLKTSDVSETTLGGEIEYKISAKNAVEAGTWHKANITDKLDTAYLELIPNSTMVNGKKVSDKDVWKDNVLNVALGDVASGKENIVTFKVKVKAIPDSKVVKNTASATGEDSEGNKVAPPDSSVNIPIDYAPGALKSLKTVSDADGNSLNGKEVKVGDTLHFEINVKNVVKDSIVTNVFIKDSLEKGFTYKAGSLKVNANTVSDNNVKGQDISVNVGDLKYNEESVLSFDVIVNDQASSEMKNVALVGGTTPEGEIPPTTTPETNNGANPEPKLEKTANVEKTHLGETFEYTIKASNAKDAAKWQDAVVKDNLDARYLTYVSDTTKVDGKAVSDAEAWSDNKLNVKIGDLGTGKSVSITFKVKVIAVPENGIVHNTTQATGTDSKGNVVTPPDASVDVPTDFQDGKLKMDKAVSDAKGNDLNNHEVKIGDTLHYDITAENVNEFGMLYNVIVKDDLVKGLEFKTGTLTVNGKAADDKNFNGQNLKINIGDLKGKEKVVIGFDVTVTKDADGKLDNVALGSGTTPGGEVPETPTPGTKNPIKPNPSLEKTASQSELKLGDTFTYTITARNAADASTWYNAVISDTLDTKHLELVAGSTIVNGKSVSDKDVWKNNILTASIGDLRSDESKVITFKAKVILIPENGKIANTAKGEGTDKDGDKIVPPDATVEIPAVKNPVPPVKPGEVTPPTKPVTPPTKPGEVVTPPVKPGEVTPPVKPGVTAPGTVTPAPSQPGVTSPTTQKELPQTNDADGTLLSLAGIGLVGLAGFVIARRKKAKN
ncbi:isopeptide-forming domain-containing fimbrial protein [Dellaglioa algida]|uniref:isopeptide-forming domain-containing fimbrial protein n=1 Tax=Dellaglioa algida TaxID=105612 RepID=UPI0024C4956B|nr:isopeptide-forming domain-containing fimbrial protein [Dellaglioa algida]MDK1728032.1 isopeptide-forming domain-containing fimbrial protein [Dellaglioa algida]MDK1735571.1 isopeptide-forming domain-containing fimbrial protein [Dellaglioa algida]MDK1737363.1 isopeptide-forming domain-containing fimbrial protein [Dellaglioa algida]